MNIAFIPEFMQSLGLIILLAAVPGLAGGLVAHFINNERAPRSPRENRQVEKAADLPNYRFESVLQSMFIGAAGGVAFIFFVSAIGAISEFRTPIELARFVSISLIAGFGARRLLPMMAGHLEKQIAHAEQSASVALDAAETTLKKLQATEKRMGDTEAKLELVRTNANLLTAASSSVSRSMRERAQIEAEKAIAGITSDAGHDTTISAIYVNLARVYRHSGNLDRAIELLEELVRKMTQNELMQNGNLAIAYYNLACYYELRHRKGAAEEELDRAMSELERAVEVSDDPREILQCALTDPDLQLLQTKKRFRELLKRFDITSPETPGG